MTARTMRKAERGAHLLWALVLVLYVYGLLPSWGEPVARWVVIPAIAASGFAMWFAARIRRRLGALGRAARQGVQSSERPDGKAGAIAHARTVSR